MPKNVRILSWNVNGLRSHATKNFLPWLKEESPEILCVQEVKATPLQMPPDFRYFPGYHIDWNPAERPGYSGVATYSKEKPLSVKTGLGIKEFDVEGRVLQSEYPEFTLFNIYFPNGQSSDERLKFKLDFYDAALDTFLKLRKQKKRIVVCGDVNTAHQAIDLARPRENEKTSGFLPQERAWVDKFVKAGFIDTFRMFNSEPGQYSWWDVRTGARQRNIGWRIDYHFISSDLRENLQEAFIMPEITGSDHCPVGIILKF